MNLKLSSTGDIDITNNAMSLVSGVEGIRQNWVSRLQTFLGDWFLDLRVGVPYYEEILKKQPNTNRLRAIFHEVTLGTPGIKQIDHFHLELADNRVLELDVDGLTEDLEKFRFTYSEMVLSQPGAE